MDDDGPLGISIQAEELIKSVRSEKTREYYLIILQTLAEAYTLPPEGGQFSGGPVRAKDLISACVGEDKIPHSAAFYRLLRRLIDAGIVAEVKKISVPPPPGPKPKYYQLIDFAALRYLQSREKILTEAFSLERLLDENLNHLDDCKIRLHICYQIMREMGIENPEELVKTHLP